MTGPMLGRFLILLGVLLAIVGGILILFGTLPRLPGDIYIQRKGFTLYVPLMSALLLSLLLTLLLNLLFARR